MLETNWPNSCYFWNVNLVFLQILHHSSVSWDITPLYFFSWNFKYFQKTEPIKLQKWSNFRWTIESLKFFILLLLLSKSYKIPAKTVQKSYLSWHWTVMKNWNKPGSFCFKIGMRNVINFRALKSLENCSLMSSFRPKQIMVNQKISEELCVMALKGDAKFNGKLTTGLRNDIRNMVNFHGSSWKSEN